MATIYRHHRVAEYSEPGEPGLTTVQMFGPEILECGFCGKPHARAYWMGVGMTKVCGQCAAEVLPKLAADAVVGELPGPNLLADVQRHLDKFRGEFWRAVALALMRQPPAEARWEEVPVPSTPSGPSLNGNGHRNGTNGYKGVNHD